MYSGWNFSQPVQSSAGNEVLTYEIDPSSQIEIALATDSEYLSSIHNISLFNSIQNKYRQINLYASRSSSIISTTVHKLGDSLSVLIDVSIVGLNVKLVIQNNELFPITSKILQSIIKK